MTRLHVAAALLIVAACAKPQRPGETHWGPEPKVPVQRVATLAPSLTDLVIALGAGDRIVGVTRFDEAPQVAKVPRIGGYSDPEPEAVIRVAPDIVLCQPSPGNKGAAEAIAKAGIPVLAMPLETLSDIDDATTRIAALLGLQEAGKREVQRLREARQTARTAAQKRPRPIKVAILFSLDPIVAAGPGTFLHEMLEDVGAVDVVQRSAQPYPKLSPENLVMAKPDAILLALMPGGGAPLEHPVAGVAAPGIPLKSGGFMRPGPLVPEALAELTALLDRLAAPVLPK